jgi:prepilin-type N-terminal cleavage/methylation domain-containing protein
MNTQNSQSGFSLMELVVVLMVMTVVMGMAFSLLNSFQQTYRYEEAYADAQRNARFAVARLNEVIRSAGTNPRAITTVNPTNFAVMIGPTTKSGTALSASSIQLRSDLDGDTLNSTRVSSNSDVIVTSENISLRLDSTTNQLIMDDNTVSPPVSIPIADHIRQIKFTDPNGSSNTNKVIIVEIIAIPGSIPAGDPRYREVTYTAAIRLRNR